jgi:predicted nucleic acid-binding Zn ribbon protein
MAVSAWTAAVGVKISNRTNPTGMVRKRLVVEVEDAVWQRQLWTLRVQILKRIEQVLGRAIVEELEFKVAAPRIKPARTEILHAASSDEADQILDPTFRSFYKAARKRANA